MCEEKLADDHFPKNSSAPIISYRYASIFTMSISFRHLGNCAHAINLLNIAAYAGCAINAYQVDIESRRSGLTETTNNTKTLFDPAWLEEGFCQPQNSIPLWTTHDQSAYVMLVISVPFLLYLFWSSRKDATNSVARKLSFWATVGAIGHAFGHALISFGKREDFYPPGDSIGVIDIREQLYGPTPEDGWRVILCGLIPSYFFFWIPLLKTYMLNTTQTKLVFLVAALGQFGALCLPLKFGFAYAQTLLFASTSIDQLAFVSAADKGFEYALWPIMTVLPNGILSWVESTSCTSSILTRRVGHVTYDLYMASSYVLFYLLCLARSRFSMRLGEDVSISSKKKIA